MMTIKCKQCGKELENPARNQKYHKSCLKEHKREQARLYARTVLMPKTTVLCEKCGKELHTSGKRFGVCLACRKAETKAIDKSWMAKTQPGKSCKTCRYWRKLSSIGDGIYACHYLLDNEHRRPVDDAGVCLGWKQKGRRKK